jgi:hypothetical protein
VTISQTKAFAKAVKKLKTNQKSDLDAAIHALVAAPESGDHMGTATSFLRKTRP